MNARITGGGKAVGALRLTHEGRWPGRFTVTVEPVASRAQVRPSPTSLSPIHAFGAAGADSTL